MFEISAIEEMAFDGGMIFDNQLDAFSGDR
jgi:hypothetical protein